MTTAPTPELGADLIWEVTEIAKEIRRSPRQTHYILSSGKLPGFKVGGRWCTSRSALREFFAAQLGGGKVA